MSGRWFITYSEQKSFKKVQFYGFTLFEVIMHNVNLSYITLFIALFFLFSAYFAKPYIIHTQITLYAMGFTSFMRATHARTFFFGIFILGKMFLFQDLLLFAHF